VCFSFDLNFLTYIRTSSGSEDLPIALESIAGYDVRELEMNVGRANEKAQSIVTTEELPLGDAETSQSPLIRTEAPFADTNGKTSISGVPADTAASFDEQAISRDKAQSTEASETDEATDTTAATPNQQATEIPARTLVGHRASCNLCNIYPIVGPLFHCIKYVHSLKNKGLVNDTNTLRAATPVLILISVKPALTKKYTIRCTK
jgi:hypothetical protein